MNPLIWLLGCLAWAFPADCSTLSLCPCSPDAADSSSFDVQLGDIILTATDGLFDNMPDYMILQELKKLKVRGPDRLVSRPSAQNSSHPAALIVLLKNTNYESIQQTAQSIAEQAHVLAYDPNYMSPFAQFACDNGLNVRGERLRLAEDDVESVSSSFNERHPNGTLPLLCPGGKPDDITVLLSIVAEYTD